MVLSLRFGGVVCCLAALVLTESCANPRAAEASRGVQQGEAQQVETVAVAKVGTETLSREVKISGEFRPYQVVDVHSKVAGFLKQINVDVGDRVKAGQVLATLKVPEMRDELAQASAGTRRSDSEVLRLRRELERTEANSRLADLSYSRLATVAQKEAGLIAQQELDDALSRKQSTDAQVAAAKAALESALLQVEALKAKEQQARTMTDYAKIVAPFSGVVTKRYADTGAMIQAGTASQSQALPVVRIAQIDRLRLIVPVPESAVPKIRVGSAVSVNVQALNKTIEGRIARISDDVQVSTRTMDVEVDVVNPGGLLVPGMYADTNLTVDKREMVLTVPVQATTSREGKHFVMVVNPEHVLEERAIQTGLETSSKVEVTGGLAKDELVVIGNRSQLKPGQRVEPKITGAA